MRWLTLGLLFAAACDAGLVDPNPTTGFTQDELPTFASGAFGPLAGYQGIGGAGGMARQFDGTTDLYLNVGGVTPDTIFTAHLHVAPCAANAGGHYKIDPAITQTIESNELWLRGRSTPVGTLFALQSFAHRTRADAASIVVHDPVTGAKMACADLEE